jgi:hypothetical protein
MGIQLEKSLAFLASSLSILPSFHTRGPAESRGFAAHRYSKIYSEEAENLKSLRNVFHGSGEQHTRII